ncbi:hypothetical protein PILCRDRAFT_802222 [Piloderma croceum F 1598]|uniref:NADP-dependent oxidoreductase domain-containing protein n=1 Tax=Piloderma croceum (strain F 1598) TaxID=765440 RepID=A0A0C3EM77_PILCF|nr:hypothetical protein PILCRDRAFT_802222 [Piloderma croceum F 1598]
MARELDLTLAPWDMLASGRFRTDAEEKARQESGEKSRTFTPDGKAGCNEDERKMCTALEKVVGEIGSKSIQAVAIAYHLQKQPYGFPIVGGRKVENLQKNIKALEIKDQMELLQNFLPFDAGFPNWIIVRVCFVLFHLLFGYPAFASFLREHMLI